ncbi:hypothetical protein [Kribbella sp. NPDC049227]|uniref:hypothetical protein n=1 Tax=Kribbella sp. NPDC049227 TaxID=3364113 RepID=UPI003710CA78
MILVVKPGKIAERRVVESLYERRSEVDVSFELACPLGLGDSFAGGDFEAAYDAMPVAVVAGPSWAPRLGPARHARQAGRTVRVDGAHGGRGGCVPVRKSVHQMAAPIS